MSDTNNTTSVDMASSDPFSQAITLLLPDGTPFNITLTDLDTFSLYNIRLSIIFGSQIGASLLLLVVLALITQPNKRRSLIFLVNATALACNFIRTLLQALYGTSGFNRTYAFFAGDFSRVPTSDYATSVAASIFTLFVLICIEVSLVFQVHVICATMKTLHRRLVMVFSTIVASIAVGFRAGLVAENIKSIVRAENFDRFKWLASATNITTTISICVFCVMFVAKLGVAMKERRKLGLKQWGPMRVLFIMGCQTGFIPAIFAILQYFTSTPQLGTYVLTLVAISLPLSSTWAAASVTAQSNQPSPNHSSPQHHPGPYNPDLHNSNTNNKANHSFPSHANKDIGGGRAIGGNVLGWFDGMKSKMKMGMGQGRKYGRDEESQRGFFFNGTGTGTGTETEMNTVSSMGSEEKEKGKRSTGSTT
ncbi:MAG: hypothetical protein M1823_003943 [Watsoniomyces obsoletus]|nr:MAG: hypothetical protein M1823_003943 [Watsoniomyces obsoletus]